MKQRISDIMFVFIVAIGASLLLAYPVKWSWNYTIPNMFDVGSINWGQAWCLCFLSRCFFQIVIDKNKNNV